MAMTSKVMETPALGSDAAHRFFSRKLALETDPADVYADMKSGCARFFLADVRSPEDYAECHAAGAVNIPHTDINAERMADYPADTLFVVYCWGPGCNGADKAALKLSALGRPVKIMIGGIEYWEEKEGYPVERA
jgi:rhodanese-related sulfurtransferase